MAAGISIRRQLMVPLLAGFFVVVSGISGVSAWLQSSRASAELERRQDQAVQVLEDAAWPFTNSVLKQISGLTGQDIVVLEPSTGTLLSSLTNVPAEIESLLQRPPANMSGRSEAFELESGASRYRVRFVNPRWQPQARLLVLLSQQTRDEARWNAVWPPAVIGGAAMLAILPWLTTITGRWSARLRDIQRQVAEIARSDVGSASLSAAHRLQGDELAALVDDVHALGERLQTLKEQLLRTEREQLIAQLVQGFAHQFRNGLSGISLALQLHLSRCRSADDRSLQILQRQLQLLETEVRGLLSLDRCAEGTFAPLNLVALLQDCVLLVEPSIEHHGLQLKIMAPVSVCVSGIRDSLRAACVNLLQNAVEAAGPGGRIRVQLLAESGRATIQISDNGPGPAPEVAERIHQAFVTTKPEGIGLGLAIVTAVARDHRGSLSWRRDQDWTVMELNLPESTGTGGDA
ncbi:MAG UNVERIFIED_CONTAM: HAMP domain-containing histidine kinase [Planctomycetaceae bacterium]